MVRQKVILRGAENRPERLADAGNPWLKEIFESSPLCIAALDASGRFLCANKALERFLGYSEEELRSLDFDQITFPDDRKHCRQLFDQMQMGKRDNYQVEKRYVRKDGGIVWGRVKVAAVRDQYGKLVHTVGMLEDVTVRARAEAALRKSRRRFETLVNSIDGIVWEADANTFDFTFVSSRAESLLGYPLSEWFQTPNAWIKHLHPDDRDAALAFCQEQTKARLPHTFDYRMIAADGRIVWQRDYVNVIAEHGEPAMLRGVMVDITERKHAEEAVRRLNCELEARVQERTDQLAAANRELEAFNFSVSHDLRAPLACVQLAVEALLADHSAQLDEAGVAKIRRAVYSAERMGKLIEAMLKLSRMSHAELHVVDVDLSQASRQIVSDLRQADPERIVDFVSPPVLNVRADLNLIKIALGNLLGNAWKFTLKTSQAKVELGTFQREGETVYFVRDNGAGFDMADQDKLFKPFYRLTSDCGFEGTGIGLSIVQRVVQRHRGRLWAESALGKGATLFFTIGTESGRKKSASPMNLGEAL